MKALSSSDWIIDLFGRALELSGWPENDSAEEHELVLDLEPGMVTVSSQQLILDEDDEEPESVDKAGKDWGGEDDRESKSEYPPVKRPRLADGADDTNYVSSLPIFLPHPTGGVLSGTQ
ncbi:hypothetical protein Clacol_006247 [Clathrus columnatus]|uniref:Uncharacterized protein n=1 Tax=Clathrus columnatus TaxID=1419009 RepID=A0AAV5AH53_9AGAM|nr:hypothetical protein Clacol_006247 [Clathrus columnatus]